MYLSQALQFMADPALAAAVSPRPDEPPFDLHGFATGQDTLYMIAQGQDEHSPMAGLFACLASEIHYAAGMVGSFTKSGAFPARCCSPSMRSASCARCRWRPGWPTPAARASR